MEEGQGYSRRTWAFAAAVVVASLVFAAAAGAGSLVLRLTVAKHKSGPYVEMSPVATVKDGAKTFYFRSKNISEILRRVTLDDVSVQERPGDFVIRWFKGHRNITPKVRAGEYRFRLEPGERRTFSAKVEPRVGHPRALCLALSHSIRPNGDAVSPQYAAIYVNSTSICG